MGNCGVHILYCSAELIISEDQSKSPKAQDVVFLILVPYEASNSNKALQYIKYNNNNKVLYVREEGTE